jgi:hypothetical protein
MKQRWKWVGALVAILVGAWLIYAVLSIAADQHEAKVDRAEQAEQIEALVAENAGLKASVQEANRRLREADRTPVEPPEDVDVDQDAQVIPLPGEKGDRGPRGPRGESCIEDIGLPECRGIRGNDGTSGTDGRDGSDGSDGRDGATGPRGLSCVEELGLDQCRGPMGPEGPAGPKGDKGEPGETPDLSGYATQAWVIGLLQALGCQVDGPGGSVLTCTITGRP